VIVTLRLILRLILGIVLVMPLSAGGRGFDPQPSLPSAEAKPDFVDTVIDDAPLAPPSGFSRYCVDLGAVEVTGLGSERR